MTDYASAADSPWFTKAEEITEINVSYGESSIGAYAFAGIENAKPVVLPVSVTSAGSEFAPAALKVFTFSEDIDFGDQAPENIYVYREEKITTNDRFWQSDKSKGDIISDSDDLFVDEGKFWRYNADEEAVEYVKTKVLFIGNSFTYRNGIVEHSSGVPGIYDNIAEDLGYAVETYSITGPGWYLENHAKPTDTCGKQVDKLLKARDDFDYVVLQNQSTVPIDDYNRFLTGVRAMQTKINDTQKHAKIYLYETWGSPTPANQYKITVPEMELKLREAYSKAGKEGYPGAYLSACVHVGNMLGGDVRKTQFVGEEKYSAPKLDENTLSALRTTGYNTVFAPDDEQTFTPPDGDTPSADDSEQKEILKIACWGRFMKEAKFKELVADFKKYCADNGVAYKEIIGTYY